MNPQNTDSDYIKYLPPAFQSKKIDGKPNFLREFLKIFEKILSGREDPVGEDFEDLKSIQGIEEIFDDIHDYFDLLYAPDEFIQWLSSWIALAINEDWSEKKKRRLRSEIVSLYKIRGTLQALERYLKIYTTDIGQTQVSEVEDLRIGNYPSDGDGDDEGEVVKTQIGVNTRIGSTSPYFFEVNISIPEPDPFVLDFKRREVVSIIDLEKPAYTYYGLRLQVGTMQIGADTLYAVHFHDEKTGWAVGSGGIILHTLDGGLSWEVQDIGVNYNLYTVYFHNANRGWAVGAGGVILHTSDGGQNWISQNSGVQTSLYSVYFHDAKQGWIAGKDGVILHTIDGGASWTSQNSGVDKILYGISFPTDLRGWVVGEDGTILTTTNSGVSWNPQVSGTTENLRAVHVQGTQGGCLSVIPFSNRLRGWAVGDGGIILATMNGNTWNAQTSGVTQPLHGVYFQNRQTGWVVGANGVILSTNDAGANWLTLNSGVSENLLDVYFQNINIGWSVGEGGVFLRTTDGGTNWSVSRSPERFGHSTVGKDTLLGTLT